MLIVVLGVRGGFDTSMTLHFHALRVINAICNAWMRAASSKLV
jgi:hypothetical protein